MKFLNRDPLRLNHEYINQIYVFKKSLFVYYRLIKKKTKLFEH